MWIRKSKACQVWRTRVRREEEAGRTRREMDMARTRMRNEESREMIVVGEMREGGEVVKPVRGSRTVMSDNGDAWSDSYQLQSFVGALRW